MKRRPAAGALIVALLVALATVAAAQPRVIRFGTTGDYPPFAQFDASGGLTGADVEIARRFAASQGARAVFVRTSWTSLSSDFAAGLFDIAIGGVTVTPERARLGTFSIPLMHDGKRPLARCREARRYASLAGIDRRGVRVQINRGPEIGALARQWLHRATLVVNTDDDTLVPFLLDGKADVWITDGVVVDHMAWRYPGRLCATTATPYTSIAKAWLVRDDPALVRATNAFLANALPAWRATLNSVR